MAITFLMGFFRFLYKVLVRHQDIAALWLGIAWMLITFEFGFGNYLLATNFNSTKFRYGSQSSLLIIFFYMIVYFTSFASHLFWYKRHIDIGVSEKFTNKYKLGSLQKG